MSADREQLTQAMGEGAVVTFEAMRAELDRFRRRMEQYQQAAVGVYSDNRTRRGFVLSVSTNDYMPERAALRRARLDLLRALSKFRERI
jgi:hypothetical protein